MILFKKEKSLRNYLDGHRENGKKTGFVPTMGALHEGHISLLKQAMEANEISICSIFVNPTQFNEPADYQKYPVTLEKDIFMLETAGCDVLFLPSVEEMYPQGAILNTRYQLGYLETILEGKYRPGHFQGVCTVVHRLLDIVKPDNLYIGQKDYQQCMVIRKLLQLTGMEQQVSIHISPILREKDGLAMSSRNMRLSEEERKTAPAIYQALCLIRENLETTGPENIKQQAISFLTQKGFKVDYIAIADADSLEPVARLDEKQKQVALAAAFLGDVRLIDNILLN
jgi:pantoate--beta-alanine ligase